MAGAACCCRAVQAAGVSPTSDYAYFMPDHDDLVSNLLDMLEDRRTTPPPRTVQMDTNSGGRDILFYERGGDGQVIDCGSLTIPAATPETRRRAVITRGCPLCPDVNQGLASEDRDLGPEVGTYVVARYRKCGHGAALRLDGDQDEVPLIFSVED